MRSFTDSQGDQWHVSVTTGTLLAIADELDLNLLDKPDDIPTELRKMVELLFVCCQEQIDSRGLNPKQFAERLDGETLTKAIDCFMRELASFSTGLGQYQGVLIDKVWDATQDLSKRQAEKARSLSSSISTDWLESLESATPNP